MQQNQREDNSSEEMDMNPQFDPDLLCKTVGKEQIQKNKNFLNK
jgi:hypothetical protein